MGWKYSVSSSTPSYYTWTGLNTLNQHCSAVPLGTSSGAAITQLKVYAAGKGGSVSTKLGLWSASGSHSLIRSSSTFTMASGSLSGGGQYWYTKSITPYVIQSSTYWVGLYRNPSGGHIAGTTASGAADNSYRKTELSGIDDMGSYSTHNKEFYVGLYLIYTPSTPTSAAAAYVSDNAITVSWTNVIGSDTPYDSIKIERKDNVYNTWSQIKSLSGTYTSYTDKTTVENKIYTYRVRAYNSAGYSSYDTTSTVYTTPAQPSNVVATRDGTNVVVTWDDNSTNETLFRIQSRESTDSGATWGSWGDVDTVLANNETYTDTSPYSYGQYRVRAEYTSTSLYSSYVESNEILTLSAPSAPTDLAPTENIDGDELNTFNWTHNPLDSTAQTKFSLQYRVQGGSFPGTPQYDEEVSTVESVDIVSSTFTNGNIYEWQVKTWGEYTTGSDWSSIATFNAYSRPTVTIDSPTTIDSYGYSELTVEWTFNQLESGTQEEYLLTLYDSNDVELETKRISSSNEYATLTTSLENLATYTIALQVKSYNLWSVETTVEFDVDFLQPTTPTLTIAEDEENGAVTINIVNPAVYYGQTETVTADTYIDNDNSSTNYDGNNLDLTNDTTGGTTIKTILLNFDLTDFIGAGYTITAATLKLYRNGTLTPGIDSTVNYIKSSWDETTVTYSTIPTLDSTDYDDHTHIAGDDESWDITTLVEDIADSTISDYYGLAIVATTTDGSSDSFTDETAEISISVTPENAETSYNQVWRSINGGDFELILTDIPTNTTTTDYTPQTNTLNTYKVEAVSIIPSNIFSSEADITLNYWGYFFLNTGENYGTFVKLYGNVLYNEFYDIDQTNIQFEGRQYPVNYKSDKTDHSITLSIDVLKTQYDTLLDIIDSTDDILYRDWNGRYFKCSLTTNKFTNIDRLSYQFTTIISRLED